MLLTYGKVAGLTSVYIILLESERATQPVNFWMHKHTLLFLRVLLGRVKKHRGSAREGQAQNNFYPFFLPATSTNTLNVRETSDKFHLFQQQPLYPLVQQTAHAMTSRRAHLFHQQKSARARNSINK